MNSLSKEIFRAYDIRGIVGDQLNPQVANLIGRAIATKAVANGADRIAVGRDGRDSSPELAKAVADGICQAGLASIELGLTPTPAAYWGAFELAEGNGVVITGSHNPKEYNGIKIMLNGKPLAGDEIEQLYLLIAESRLSEGGVTGVRSQASIMEEYLDELLTGHKLSRPVKVVVDCGNGVTGPSAPLALERLGCEVLPLFTEVDGSFPNHHPDPANPANFETAIKLMREQNAEITIAFDGDGDRLGVALPDSGVIYPDRFLLALVQDFLRDKPGETVVFDVKCSRVLEKFITQNGGKPVMCRTGHSFVKQHMAEIGAKFGGELSGHIFFNEGRWRFDDALLAAVKLLSLVAATDSAESLFASLPNAPASPEYTIRLPENAPPPQKIVDNFVAIAKFSVEPEKLITIDGYRAEWQDGFGLVRASNTTPSLVARFEGDSQQSLTRIQNEFRENLQKLPTNLSLPF